MADTPQDRSSMTDDTRFQALLDSMIAEAHEEAAGTFSPDQITAFARDLWDWSQHVEPGEQQVRFRSAHASHRLEVIGPDRPFLVDSLLNVCAAQGFEVRALFHPILDMGTGAKRSVIQIHTPPLSPREQEVLLAEARLALADVTMATSDHAAMRARMSREVERLAASRHVSDEDKSEAIAFLNWLSNDHFVFLGARDYTFATGPDGRVLPEEPDMVAGSNLGLLRDETRNVLNRGAEPLVINRAISDFLAEPQPLILAKSTLVSRVHRRTVCDYVGVKHYGETGLVNGETRFLGLYTSEAYHNSVREVPLVRRRAARVLAASGALKGTYNEKALSNILESWPRDELIQTDAETLTPMMLGALKLIGRPRVRLFVRRDRFDRFVSAIVFVPRETYDTAFRERITKVLEDAFHGKLTRFEPSFDGTALVRVLFEIALPDAGSGAGEDARPLPDLQAVEDELAALSRTWNERFREAIMADAFGAGERTDAALFVGAFNAAYREAFAPEEAIEDVISLGALSGKAPIRLRAFRLPADEPDVLRAKIYSRSGAIALSDCVPILERMGLFVAYETGYPVRPSARPVEDAPDTYWIHALSMRLSGGHAAETARIAAAFEDAFVAVWSGAAENDGFNALVFSAGLTWREAALLRALCAYRHQSGLDPARQTQIDALKANPGLARALVDLFAIRCDPATGLSLSQRSAALAAARGDIDERLKSVPSLDHDRVIRRLAELIGAIQRSNFYQATPGAAGPAFIAFKIASRELADLPAPKPFREIFMSSPLVEGVHCRFGAVARGGLRWSDRRDDYRTEVLGLVKAQQVKNAVIVPVGSKGGFYPKQIPLQGTREQVRDAGIAAYQCFITALLGLTDNLVKGKVAAPADTVIWDGEDPYLVVAADKGTATFSDIANEISLAHGFWLGDAFASGGSAGYDHKKMGITARGGWEAVKRHFRELGRDIQTEPFTVIGCGDMSGDVFGNGMLLSQYIRLQAAFNHMHIFIDPDPADTERLWTERKRIFDLPRSTWADYDTTLISEGGGIFERSAKSITLSAQIKALTGLKHPAVTPDELIHALLKVDCDLMWFGGIGTYVKASSETHDAVGDRSNDAVRVNGSEIGAKVIGEGANLGLTQAGRIEFAQAGGRINTDAIDNSAGVDSSDHEVNIKILCTEAIRQGELPTGERNFLLASMTEDVAQHVLAHNYSQTAALSLAAHTASADHDALERLMLRLESRGMLDRRVEGLPGSTEMRARKLAGKSLTRPELAVIMAWTKIVLFDELTASGLPDDPYFNQTLAAYFPDALRRFEGPMQTHPLKREIISTVVANRLVDLAGPVLLLRLREQSGADNSTIAAAFEAARMLLQADAALAEINTLDNLADAAAQIALRQALAHAVSDLTLDLLLNAAGETVSEVIARIAPIIERLHTLIPSGLSRFEADRFKKTVKHLSAGGAPEALAVRLATHGLTSDAPELAVIASGLELPTETVFAAHQVIGEGLHLDRLRANARIALKDMPYWDRLATRRLIGELQHLQGEAVRKAMASGGVEAWLGATASLRKQLVKDIATFTESAPSFAQFALAASSVRAFMQVPH